MSTYTLMPPVPYEREINQGLIVFTLLSAMGLILYLLRGKNSILTPSNNSVWESLKLIYYPALFLGLIVLLSSWPCNFVVPWILATLFALYYYVTLYYTYTGIFGFASMYLVVSTYLYALVLGLCFFYYFRRREHFPAWVVIVSVISMATLGILFVALTFYHPNWGIFAST